MYLTLVEMSGIGWNDWVTQWGIEGEDDEGEIADGRVKEKGEEDRESGKIYLGVGRWAEVI